MSSLIPGGEDVPMTTQCCEKCKGQSHDWVGAQTPVSFPYCVRPDCPCHQTHTTKEGWRERFDEKFTVGQTYWRPEKEWHSYGNQTQPDAIKAFIASEIQKAQVKHGERLVREIDRIMNRVEGFLSTTNNENEEIQHYFAEVRKNIEVRITNQSGE